MRYKNPYFPYCLILLFQVIRNNKLTRNLRNVPNFAKWEERGQGREGKGKKEKKG